MITQVIFNIDKKLKEQAMKKAESKGFTYSAILKFATKAFVEDKFDIGLIPTEKFNSKTAREISKALKDIKRGKNISPHLHFSEEVMSLLKN
jgi:antitoxin component of RelBE/YafQ-DinJ toxin-antitoxin module